MAKNVIIPQGLIDLRSELMRMQKVARKHNGGKGYSIVSFDKIADFERRITAMEKEIARLQQEYGSGSAFKGNYEGRYNQSAKQREAARTNISNWNALVKEYGRDKAKKMKDRVGNANKLYDMVFNKAFYIDPDKLPEIQGGATRGQAAKDRYSQIVDIVFNGAYELAHAYDSDDLFDAIDNYDPELPGDFDEQYTKKVDISFDEFLRNNPLPF